MTRHVSARLSVLVALTLAFKFWLAANFPFTGDEAYFALWGAEPALGFYDHPPMIGWLLAPLLEVSWAEWVLRLPVVILPLPVAAGIYWMLREHDREKAVLAAIAYLLMPVNLWNVFITTDTPLILFSFASALAYWRALLRRSAALYLLAGALLGLALLSKYFAVLLALVYFVHIVSAPGGRRDWGALALVCAGALPFAAVNAWWNYENCWANLLFNLYNRHGDAGLSWKTPLLYGATLLYVLSPVAMAQLARARPEERWRESSPRFFLLACALPFGVFAILSSVKLIGLHWVLSFVPFFFVASALALSRAQMRGSVVFLAMFGLAHVAAIVAVAALPLDMWKSTRIYDGIVFHFRIDELLLKLSPYRGEFRFAADGYSPAVTASYYAQRLGIDLGPGTSAALQREKGGHWRRNHVIVFGPASSHARHDDILTDFRRLDGANILVMRKNPPEDENYRPFFRSVEYRTVAIEGATFHFVLGRGFDYGAYRNGVLAPLRDRYYRIPAYLPQGRCYFCERYFDSRTCPIVP